MENEKSRAGRPDLPVIPRLEEVSPAYASLCSSRLALTKRYSETEGKIGANITVMRDANQMRYQQRERAAEIPNARVAALLGEEYSKDANLSLEQETSKLQDEARDIQTAMSVLDKRIEEARLDASALICKMIEPAVKSLLSELASQMARVSHMALRYRQITQELNSAQIAWANLDPMGIRIGGVAEKGSPYVLWLTAAAQRGYIAADELPKEICP